MTNHTKNTTIITIDGSAGVGKGTLSKLIAQTYNAVYLDSGAIYRSFTFCMSKKYPNLFTKILATKSNQENLFTAQEIDLLSELALNFEINFIAQENNKTQDTKIILTLVTDSIQEEFDITNSIRNEQISIATSKVSSIKEIRDNLIQKQRNFALTNTKLYQDKNSILVADGRDMGSFIFPLAEIKFFLSASPEVKAERRYKQLQASGVQNLDFNEILDNIKQRDLNDSQRKASPLQVASDMIVVDTSNLNIDEVFTYVKNKIEEKITF